MHLSSLFSQKSKRDFYLNSMNTLVFIQGFYYFFFGLWPIIHYRSFEAVSGPKMDQWLVITVGWLLTASSVAMLVSHFTTFSVPILVIAIGQALALAGVDIYYVLKKRISRVYLLDAMIELAFVFTWILFGGGGEI
jgi:hypothetical protein